MIEKNSPGQKVKPLSCLCLVVYLHWSHQHHLFGLHCSSKSCEYLLSQEISCF